MRRMCGVKERKCFSWPNGTCVFRHCVSCGLASVYNVCRTEKKIAKLTGTAVEDRAGGRGHTVTW